MTARPLLLCDCYLDEHGATDNFAPLFSGRSHEVVRPAHAPWQRSATEYSAIIITGSAASIVMPPDWVSELEQLVREAADQDIPTLGVCFGHQVIARALSGAGAVRTSPVGELGWFDVSHTGDDPILEAIDNPFRTFVSHREEVTPNTPGLRVLASTADCHNHAFRVGTKRMWGVQFHSEIRIEEATRLIRARAAKHPEQQIDLGTALSRAVDSTRVAGQIIDNFLGQL